MITHHAQGQRTAVIAGGSGLVGAALRQRLEESGWRVRRLVRRAATSPVEVPWAPDRGELDPAAVSGVDAVINLSGASIGQLPWTRARRTELVRSRLDSTDTLVAALRRVEQPPRVFLSASGHGWYGSRPGELLPESATGPGTGFLAQLAAAWEEAAQPAADVSRLVLLRSGDVLAPSGGILGVLKGVTRWGLGHRPGNGKQHWPWVSLRDEVGAIIHLIDHPINGPVNLAGPTPATADTVTRTIARLLHRPRLLPAPAWGLRLVLREAADDLLLASRALVPEHLLQSGYAFEHATVESALAWALHDAQEHRG